MSKIQPHTRINDILLAPLEKPALQWLAARMPSWVSPDLLTLFGIFGAIVILFAYLLANWTPGFLWLASLGLIINWFGDSLDGTMARYRQIERPKYGFFVDHTVDSLNEVLIRRVQLFLVRNELLKTKWMKRMAINPESKSMSKKFTINTIG
ncbi:MAG: CDP-alcohol phosphatidyltransferase family protein [Cyanobacteria bacterium J06600_6]